MIAVVQEKTGTEVFVPLHPALARSIKAGPSKGVYLIGDKNGRPITRRSLTVLISTAVKGAGLSSECVAHGLRKAPRYGGLRNTGRRRSRYRLYPATSPLRKLSGIHSEPISNVSLKRPSARCRTKIEHQVANPSPVSQLAAESDLFSKYFGSAALNEGLIAPRSMYGGNRSPRARPSRSLIADE